MEQPDRVRDVFEKCVLRARNALLSSESSRPRRGGSRELVSQRQRLGNGLIG
jgi:hypothetical protein